MSFYSPLCIRRFSPTDSFTHPMWSNLNSQDNLLFLWQGFPCQHSSFARSQEDVLTLSSPLSHPPPAPRRDLPVVQHQERAQRTSACSSFSGKEKKNKTKQKLTGCVALWPCWGAFIICTMHTDEQTAGEQVRLWLLHLFVMLPGAQCRARTKHGTRMRASAARGTRPSPCPHPFSQGWTPRWGLLQDAQDVWDCIHGCFNGQFGVQIDIFL